MTQSSDLQPWIRHFAPPPACKCPVKVCPPGEFVKYDKNNWQKNYIFIKMPCFQRATAWCCSCRQKKKQQQWLYASILGVEGKERIKPNVNFMIVSTMKLPSWPNSFLCMRSSMGQWSNDCGWWLIFGRVIEEQDAQDIHHIIVSQVLNPKYNFQIDHKLNYEHKHHTCIVRYAGLSKYLLLEKRLVLMTLFTFCTFQGKTYFVTKLHPWGFSGEQTVQGVYTAKQTGMFT